MKHIFKDKRPNALSGRATWKEIEIFCSFLFQQSLVKASCHFILYTLYKISYVILKVSWKKTKRQRNTHVLWPSLSIPLHLVQAKTKGVNEFYQTQVGDNILSGNSLDFCWQCFASGISSCQTCRIARQFPGKWMATVTRSITIALYPEIWECYTCQ